MYVPASLFDNETPPHCTAAMDCLIFRCNTYYKNYSFICFQFNSELFRSKYANRHVCMWTLTAWNKYYYSLECAEITNLYNTQKYSGGPCITGFWYFEKTVLLDFKKFMLPKTTSNPMN